MKIEVVQVGELACNCYLLDIEGEVLIIDPGDESEKIDSMIRSRKVVGILITHSHFDHIGAVLDLVKKYDVDVFDYNHLSAGVNKIGKFTFEVIYTPGHKEDAITIYFKENKAMFCGDFLFKGSIGRCDLPGGNMQEMMDSLKKIKEYDRDIVLYPGHGEKTTLGDEIDNNPYFTFKC